MNNAFWDATIGLRLFERGAKTLPATMKVMAHFEATFRKASPLEIEYFIDENQHELKNMKLALLQKLNGKPVPEFTALRVRLFDSLFKRVHESMSVSTVFESFVQGITYFMKEQSSTVPIYHRLQSCGERGGGNVHDILRRCDSGTDEEKLDAQKRVYNCLVERLIYDHMYRHIHHFFPVKGDEVPEQDKSHVDRIKKTMEEFNTCFPEMIVEIDIVYNGIYPQILWINKSIRGKRGNAYQEIYKKTMSVPNVYDPIVECLSKKANGVYVKFQTFAQPGVWKKVKDATKLDADFGLAVHPANIEKERLAAADV